MLCSYKLTAKYLTKYLQLNVLFDFNKYLAR